MPKHTDANQPYHLHICDKLLPSNKIMFYLYLFKY